MHNTHKTHNKYNITSRLSQGGLSAVSKDLLVSYFRCMKHYHIIYYIIYHTYYILYKNIIYVTYIYMYMYVYVYVYVYIYVFVYVYVCIYIYIYIYISNKTEPGRGVGRGFSLLALCAQSLSHSAQTEGRRYPLGGKLEARKCGHWTTGPRTGDQNNI